MNHDEITQNLGVQPLPRSLHPQMSQTRQERERSIAVGALKRIQYVYTGAGQSYEDLCRVKQITERALKRLRMWNVSLSDFRAK